MGINDHNWKGFFFNSNEGLGTLYDRMILERFFERFITDYGIKSVLDCPSFGMTGFSGLNSLYLARNGAEVTVCENNPERLEWIEALWKKIGLKADFKLINNFSKLPFENRSFDLVWNLSALWYFRSGDILRVIKELGRVTDKCLFISVHNKNQLFYPVWKRVEPEFFHNVNEENSDSQMLERVFKEALNEFNIKESGYFVTTPWPGIILKKDQIFDRKNITSVEYKLDDIKIPQYVDYLMDRKLNTRIKNLIVLERLPDALKKYWAHLGYWIFIR